MSMKTEVPRSALLERTLELLRNRPRTKTLEMIATDTGLPESWLNALISKPVSPSVDRIVILYEYLSGNKLEIR